MSEDITPGTVDNPNLSHNLATLIGMRFLELKEGFASGELEVRSDLLQPWGFLHGGAIVSLADSLCGMACSATLDTSKEYFLSVELKVNFIRAVRSGTVHAEAKLINRGRQIQLWECRMSDDAGKLVAYMTVTQLVQPLKA